MNCIFECNSALFFVERRLNDATPKRKAHYSRNLLLNDFKKTTLEVRECRNLSKYFIVNLYF